MKSKRAREAVEVDDKPVVSVDAEAPAKKRKRNEDDGADVKKAKKEKRDKKFKKESRKERKEKRKDLQDLPEQDDDEEVDQAAEDTPMAGTDKPADATADKDKPAKKDKKKKDKKAKTEESQPQEDASADAQPKDDSKKKSKKDKKKQNKSSDTTTANDEDATGAEAEAPGADADGKADRHIVFVGNLPFTATAETIQAHFASLNPVGVRCMSDPKDSKPCRGFAFVEFSKVWHMRTCLDKFHHSEFSDGISYPRRINVELTAGGGGKTKQRQDKIKEKNRKLNENRTKRIERERIAKDEAKPNGDSRQAGEDGIHPSRRAHIPGNGR
ncbi:hypothetical protein FSARC_12716 [Fusarium sarcochroum]|uniref:RRM domain-containing protein n=1 Tax=Fusarium sarcochroum TaxID=1208366 RepID=A0A8H4WW63_9HYPO|nr:hypothetical protein FSARC_12716 [Fusarium sarcochroum]